jgi:hypothetical protein
VGGKSKTSTPIPTFPHRKGEGADIVSVPGGMGNKGGDYCVIYNEGASGSFIRSILRGSSINGRHFS